MIKIACFGVGVNSVAGILHYGSHSYDEIIFSDTGSEKPETYEYLKFLTEKKGWKIKVINDHFGKSLFDYYLEKKTYPSRVFRTCTDKFKIRPIKRYLREKYGKKETFEMNIFIALEEYHRMKTGDVNYQKLVYPLVYDKINRDGCLKIIQDAGYPLPIKSGCWMCPFNTRGDWSKLKVNHPDLFEKSLQLEKIGFENTTSKKMEPLVRLKGKESMDLFQCNCF
tara:strand:+ start:188 stop:859 length:672 start_codon:yes stop_codon:yes gene_type:complete